uniref:Uncharacterized protein n=1 Tax=Oryza glumipatula TaxID=40148 RepID=A0A0D9YCF7_9ORYZ
MDDKMAYANLGTSHHHPKKALSMGAIRQHGRLTCCQFQPTVVQPHLASNAQVGSATTKGWCHSFQLEKHKLRHKASVSSLPMHPHKSCAIAATESSSEEAGDTGSGDPGLPADGSGWLVRTFVAIFLSNGVDNVIWFVFMLLIPDLANVAKEKETTKLVAIKGSSATMDEVGCTVTFTNGKCQLITWQSSSHTYPVLAF